MKDSFFYDSKILLDTKHVISVQVINEVSNII